MNIKIRRETATDYRKVEETARDAFWNLYVPGCDEHYLIHVMRNHADFIPELSFIAEVDNKIAGGIMYTRSLAMDELGNKMNTLTFGPLFVAPEFQRKGIGTQLIDFTKEIAEKNNEKAIIILGYPYNYCRHGFKNCIDFNISNCNGRFPYGQLVLEIEKNTFKNHIWKYCCSQVYNIDALAADEYDRQFPCKKKEYRTSQEEFSIAVRAFLEKN